MMDKPIVPHEIQQVYAGRIFSLAIESVTLPHGRTARLDVIRHPGSVVLLPVTDQGEVILVRQYRHAVGKWLWELPAGSLKHGEDPERAAARECHEEIGLVPGRLERLGAFLPTPGYCDEEMILYKASGLRPPGTDETAHQDEDEDLEPRPFALDELRRLIDVGEIVDLKTIAGVLLLSR